MPLLPPFHVQAPAPQADQVDEALPNSTIQGAQPGSGGDEQSTRSRQVKTRNRRKRYLDAHPEYFGPSLELADPLLYDRLIRRFQSAAERETEGRVKGYSGILEADLLRSEAKMEALAHPDPNVALQYSRGPNGEIVADDGDGPADKEEGKEVWRKVMEMRFLGGGDGDFDYREVDDNEEWDDNAQERRDAEDEYFGQEEPSWVLGEDKRQLSGETGVQDF